MELFIDIILIFFLIILAIAIINLNNVFASVMLSSIFSLVATCLYVFMDAVDVAFTEIAVGGAIATLLFLSAIVLTGAKYQTKSSELNIPVFIIVILTGSGLMYGMLDMPSFGSNLSPVQLYLADTYVVMTPIKFQIPNMVTSILASYRGYDTLGEVTVIFTAGIAILILLGHRFSAWRGNQANYEGKNK